MWFSNRSDIKIKNSNIIVEYAENLNHNMGGQFIVQPQFDMKILE